MGVDVMAMWEHMTRKYDGSRGKTKEEYVRNYRAEIESKYPDLTVDHLGLVTYANNVLHRRYNPSDDPGRYREPAYYYTDDNGQWRTVVVKDIWLEHNNKRRSDLPDDVVVCDKEGWE